MKNSKLKIQNYRLLFGILHLAFCILAAQGQSTNQNFPTAVSTNEISGTIRARDIGDARLTSYFYTFNGVQGDIFINVVTKNLDGDIDVFTAEGLRPLTKIRVYSDNPEGETGRVIYLRQPQKLILRIEGRTPTDEPASFRIKFAGSFQAVASVAETDESKQPEVKNNEETDVRVNSVGTIIEIKPKPTPKPTVAKVEREAPKKSDEKPEPEKTEPEIAKKDEPEDDNEDKKPQVVITDNLPEKKDDTETKPEEAVAEKETPKKNPTPRRRTNPRTRRNPPSETTETKPKPQPEKKPVLAPIAPAELVNIRLVVDFKDGKKIDLPMSEILKFGIDKGILTIIGKDGVIRRYSILDIAKITVE
jgi:hypothetical protein